MSPPEDQTRKEVKVKICKDGIWEYRIFRDEEEYDLLIDKYTKETQEWQRI